MTDMFVLSGYMANSEVLYMTNIRTAGVISYMTCDMALRPFDTFYRILKDPSHASFKMRLHELQVNRPVIIKLQIETAINVITANQACIMQYSIDMSFNPSLTTSVIKMKPGFIQAHKVLDIWEDIASKYGISVDDILTSKQVSRSLPFSDMIRTSAN